jgi:hypothetical protein
MAEQRAPEYSDPISVLEALSPSRVRAVAVVKRNYPALAGFAKIDALLSMLEALTEWDRGELKGYLGCKRTDAELELETSPTALKRCEWFLHFVVVVVLQATSEPPESEAIERARRGAWMAADVFQQTGWNLGKALAAFGLQPEVMGFDAGLPEDLAIPAFDTTAGDLVEAGLLIFEKDFGRSDSLFCDDFSLDEIQPRGEPLFALESVG